MKKAIPVIGISSGYQKNAEYDRIFLNHNYLDALRAHGAIPLVIPTEGTGQELQALLSLCDGLILSGGADLDPARYGEDILNDTVKFSPVRDENELQLCRLAAQRQMPILGICRGAQVINVCFGGTLYQDIPSQLDTEVSHRMEPGDRISRHSCAVTPGSPLAQVLGTESFGVNSHHHQAIKDVAPGFEVMGRCGDGIIEAIWKPDEKFLWALQWHPEKIFDLDEPSCRIFDAFIHACR